MHLTQPQLHSPVAVGLRGVLSCYLTHPMDSFSTTLSLGCSLHPHYQHSAFTLLYLFAPQKGRVKVLNVLPQLALEGYLTR